MNGIPADRPVLPFIQTVKFLHLLLSKREIEHFGILSDALRIGRLRKRDVSVGES